MGMDTNFVKLLRSGLDAYLASLEGGGLAPSTNYLPYEFDQVDHHQWPLMGGEMVKDELRETTNNLNRWHGSLYRWHAWNRALEPFGEQDAWELRNEFVDALAHQCLLQPSAIRDSLTFMATNAIHQVRLALCNGYRDHLEGDPEVPGDPPKHLTRRKKEQRLTRLMAPWSEARKFLVLLHQIDDAAYREATSDYRNRSSHAIGPRLAVGFTRFVVRSVEQATEMTERDDGTFMLTPKPGKMSVCYGFGGTPPLNMEEARIINLAQYQRARECFECYRSIMTDAIAAMPLKRQS